MVMLAKTEFADLIDEMLDAKSERDWHEICIKLIDKGFDDIDFTMYHNKIYPNDEQYDADLYDQDIQYKKALINAGDLCFAMEMIHCFMVNDVISLQKMFRVLHECGSNLDEYTEILRS